MCIRDSFLHAQQRLSASLYELLLNDALEVVVASSSDDEAPAVLPAADCLRPVGFADEEALLPFRARSLDAYRNLTEFFAFPDKFLFIDFANLPREKLDMLGDVLELHVLFRRTSSDLEQTVKEGTLALGCVPVVNLFKKSADAQTVSATQTEVKVEADARSPHAIEVYSVDRVRAVSPQGGEIEYLSLIHI